MKKHLVGLAYLGKAQVYYLMGDIAAASTFVEQALGCVSLHDDSVSVPEVYGLKGMIVASGNTMGPRYGISPRV